MEFNNWEKLVAHVSAVAGVFLAPISYPIAIGMALWITNKYGRQAGRMCWMYMWTHIKFQWDHNLKKFLKDYEYYLERFSEALDMAL